MVKKIFAVVSIFLQLIIVFKNAYYYLQIHSIYGSPLIPHSTVNHISTPYLIVIISVIPFSIVSSYLFNKGKYFICIIIGVVALFWEYIACHYL